MTRVQRSCVAFWGQPHATVEQVVGGHLACWPIDTQQDRVAFFLHLHTNWDLRAVWVLFPPSAETTPYRMLCQWWGGIDGGCVPLSTRDFRAVITWVSLHCAQDITPTFHPTALLRTDFHQKVDIIEELYGPRTE